MAVCAPDLEWPGAQNSYHAPGARQGPANLTVPAGPGGDGGGGSSLAEQKGAGTGFLRGKSRGCHRRPGRAAARSLAAPPGPASARSGTWRRFQLK